MKTGNPSEPRETFLKKLAYRKASGQGTPGTLSGNFDLSNTRDRLEHLNNTIAHSERLLATDLDKVMEHRFPITDDDLAIDSAIQRALGLMQRARSLVFTDSPPIFQAASRAKAREFRAEYRLLGHQDTALCLRGIPASRPHAHHADEKPQ
jgi:hypothetical protein